MSSLNFLSELTTGPCKNASTIKMIVTIYA